MLVTCPPQHFCFVTRVQLSGDDRLEMLLSSFQVITSSTQSPEDAPLKHKRYTDDKYISFLFDLNLFYCLIRLKIAHVNLSNIVKSERICSWDFKSTLILRWDTWGLAPSPPPKGQGFLFFFIYPAPHQFSSSFG